MSFVSRIEDNGGEASESISHGPTTQDNSLKERAISFEVGIKSFPYLADHGLQNMTVLPGSLYVDLALRAQDAFHLGSPNKIKRVEFRQPVILSDKDVTLSVKANRLGNDTVQYTFQEAGDPGVSTEPVCAILEIEAPSGRSPVEVPAAFSADSFQKRAAHLGDRASFYQRLAGNGNQYGTHFQSLQQVWRAGEEILGRLQINPAILGNRSQNGSTPSRNHLDPVLMDGVLHLLSAFFLDQGRTFILQGIESISLFQNHIPDTAWVHGRLRPTERQPEGSQTGNVDVFDDTGACCLSIQGVRFAYVERSENQDKAATQMVVASTFTAEPVEESLQFWSDHLKIPLRVSFAPYNQVFQELLGASSQLKLNQDGINVILLNLGDWSTSSRHSEAEKTATHFGNLKRHVLPNGLEIAHLNRHETEYVYKEIFEDRCYLRHGIRLASSATVIDIGANIGLFSLFVRSQSPQGSIYAFEPSPVTFEALKANCETYGPRLHPFNAGVSERRGVASFTFYNKSSVFSSFHPSAGEDRRAIQQVVANMVRHELGDASESVDEYATELMADRLEQQTFECPLLSVSDIIRENGLQRVDLLKVDAEKCELEILRGIEASHWPLINQVVVEVHDASRRAVEKVQELLAKHGFQCAVEEESLLTGSGLFNVYATRTESESAATERRTPTPDVQGKIDLFVQALEAFIRGNRAPTILCLCPPGLKGLHSAMGEQEFAAGEQQLVERVRGLPNVQVIRSETILARYPAARFHDPHANEAGHVPYTPEGFAAIGSSVFRLFAGLRRVPYKVIVLDCDNTLWRGACGEEGVSGVTVTSAHRGLQEFMIRQMTSGMLICLCSKNNEEDVWAVLAQNPGMMLKREHIAAARINWSSKSENLESLARELNLGLDSFIFLDDNPVECAEVRGHCPQVHTLQLPADAGQLPQFLEHVWAFDHLRITEEDRTRTQKVLENSQRENYRQQVATLKDFIDGLQLQTTLFEPGPEQISRVAQLTLRTNQFNFTTIRRSESDVARFLENEAGHCLAITASDRFGDYGMVGVLFYRDAADSWDVDTFLLSCRVLGRGVEHQVLAKFGRMAMDHNKQRIILHFRTSEKNQPAWKFIESIGSELAQKTDKGLAFPFPAATLADLHYDPDSSSQDSAEENESAGNGLRRHSPAAIAGTSELFQRAAEGLHNAKNICAEIQARKSHSVPGAGTGEELPDNLAGKILAFWRKTLGNQQIGLNDNFTDAGGTSLKAVQLVATIRRELHLQVSIVNIFESPTARLLAEKFEPGKASGEAVNQALERGAKRRSQMARRSTPPRAPSPSSPP